MKNIFITDCEGPISRNDNAFELASKLIPEGATLFTLISKYDDVQAELIRRSGYRAGDTLRLILPFLKAFGATNDILRTLSRDSLVLVPGAKETLSLVRELMPSFIVSTSYEQYISSLCELTGFPIDNVYCTNLDLDRFEISTSEVSRLRRWAAELVKLPIPTVPIDARSIADLERRDRETIEYLNDLFWAKMQNMVAEAIIREVRPIGGEEKVEAVKGIVKKCSSGPNNIIYVGDSITDAAPLRYVRERCGLAVSFNGNQYAIREAEIAIISGNTLVTSILAAAFNKGKRESVKELVADWNYEKIEEVVSYRLRARAEEVYRDKLPKVEIISNSNKERLTDESCSFRKEVRGEAIGNLG